MDNYYKEGTIGWKMYYEPRDRPGFLLNEPLMNLSASQSHTRDHTAPANVVSRHSQANRRRENDRMVGGSSSRSNSQFQVFSFLILSLV